MAKHLRTHNPEVAGSNPAPATELTRIKEIRDVGVSDHEVVAHGLERTGRIYHLRGFALLRRRRSLSTSKIVFIEGFGLGRRSP